MIIGMQRPVGRTRLQGRKDVHQSGLFSTLFENVPDPVFLAEIFLANVLDLETIRLRQCFRMRTNLLTQRLRKIGIIKNPNALTVQIPGHTLSVT